MLCGITGNTHDTVCGPPGRDLASLVCRSLGHGCPTEPAPSEEGCVGGCSTAGSLAPGCPPEDVLANARGWAPVLTQQTWVAQESLPSKSAGTRHRRPAPYGGMRFQDLGPPCLFSPAASGLSFLGKAQLYLTVNQALRGVACQVQPPRGLEAHTVFSVFCTSGRPVSTAAPEGRALRPLSDGPWGPEHP